MCPEVTSGHFSTWESTVDVCLPGPGLASWTVESRLTLSQGSCIGMKTLTDNFCVSKRCFIGAVGAYSVPSSDSPHTSLS